MKIKFIELHICFSLNFKKHLNKLQEKFKMNISLKDYHYELPEEKIAKYPTEPRDASKLLVYKNGEMTHQRFYDLPSLLPEKSFLFFNNTKVVPARMFFQKEGGAVIEIFVLEPALPSKIVALAMQQTKKITCLCLIGNKKRMKGNDKLIREVVYEDKIISLTIAYHNADENLIDFEWDADGLRWIDILNIFGELPLPPYFNRKPEKGDDNKYQTVFAKEEGAVAAPTAGLHFSEKVLSDIEKLGIKKDFITLHVSAGTFQPIKVENAVEHSMHSEQVIFSLQNLENILFNIGHIIAVGTTSLRALESLYWFGVKLLLEKEEIFSVKKLYPYQLEKEKHPDKIRVLENLVLFMKEKNIVELIGETEIFIFPGYEFKICNGLITNYHLPETTLILLVAAFVGPDWRKIYESALENNYRFLSYGDSSLLLP